MRYPQIAAFVSFPPLVITRNEIGKSTVQIELLLFRSWTGPLARAGKKTLQFRTRLWRPGCDNGFKLAA
ncbi:MAG: hypothetical protein J2P49_11565 [Methylocapsa sp.]|nr:hypothetical protein [Methylocapsa sp.]